MQILIGLFIFEFSILLPGIGLFQLFFKNFSLTFHEKLLLILVGGLFCVPFLNAVLAMYGGIFLSAPVILITAAIINLLLLKPIWKFLITIIEKPVSANLVWLNNIEIVLFVIPLFYFTHHNNEELWYQLSSYFNINDANCFHLQMFHLLEDLNGRNGQNFLELVWETHLTLSSPGNVIVPAFLLNLFKNNGLSVCYALMSYILAVTAFYSAQHIVKNRYISLLLTLLLLFNPLILNTEVLDRNFIALALSSVIFYLLFKGMTNPLIIGFLFGITAGTGLKFIMLAMIIPIAACYVSKKKATILGVIYFIGSFSIAFLINYRHILVHPPEKVPTGDNPIVLLFSYIVDAIRNPFLPFPNYLFYLNEFVYFSGLAVSVITLVGIFYGFRHNIKKLIPLFLFFILPFAVIGTQKHWLEADKGRILLSILFPLFIFFLYGVKYLITRLFDKETLLQLTLLIIIFLLSLNAMKLLNFKPYDAFYKQSWVYSKEKPTYIEFLKSQLSKYTLFPNYGSLGEKIDSQIKKLKELKAEKVFFHNFKKEALEKFNKLEGRWNLKKEDSLKNLDDFARKFKVPEVNEIGVSLDFSRPFDTNSFSFVKENNNIETANFKKTSAYAYYGEIQTNWQERPITVTIEQDEYRNQINIDLNSYIKIKEPEGGIFETDIISNGLKKLTEQPKLCRALIIKDKKFIINLPSNFKLNIRYWLINISNNRVHRIDSWQVSDLNTETVKVSFLYNSPEVYW